MSDLILNICKQFPWVDMMVFHELVVPGLVQFVTPDDKDWWKRNSGPVPGPQTDRLCEVARKANSWLIPGSMWEIEGDKMYNTSVVISPDGDIVAKYRKMFPWLPYEAGTAAGDQFCVFDIPGVGCFGLCICYDMWFPEVARTLAWMGAEVIIQPTLTPTSDRPLELIMARANALFEVPFEVKVVFSTNLPPSALGDEAFFRRIQSKVFIGPIADHAFDEILRRVSAAHGIDCLEEDAAYLRELTRGRGDGDLRPYVPIMVCEILKSICAYEGTAPTFTRWSPGP